jgi:hypothetical protein
MRFDHDHARAVVFCSQSMGLEPIWGLIPRDRRPFGTGLGKMRGSKYSSSVSMLRGGELLIALFCKVLVVANGSKASFVIGV